MIGVCLKPTQCGQGNRPDLVRGPAHTDARLWTLHTYCLYVSGMEIELSASRLRYQEFGEGPPVVFVHGLLVNGDLWRKVVPVVAGAGYRCLVPDWPLGAHSVARARRRPHAAGPRRPGRRVPRRPGPFAMSPWSPTTPAGRITQLVMADHPARIGRVVLTPCDASRPSSLSPSRPCPAGANPRRHYGCSCSPCGCGPRTGCPSPSAGLPSGPRRPTSSTRSCCPPVAIPRFAPTYAASCPPCTTAHPRRRFTSRRFHRPVLLAWAREDRLFPLSLASRLAAVLPDARLELIDDSTPSCRGPAAGPRPARGELSRCHRRSQEERTRSTRSALTAAARSLFTERGYAAVSTDEIVRAAGVTRGALYHHYADKQALFRDVFEQLETR